MRNGTGSMALLSRYTEALRGEVAVPGDKSISHRVLILGSQRLGTLTITGLLEGDDVLRTAAALQQCGVKIEKNKNRWLITGAGAGGLQAPSQALDLGNSGTGARLLMGLLSSYGFTTRLTGDASLSRRPMERVITPLRMMGAQFTASEGNRLPIILKGTPLPIPIRYTLPVASAQVKSAILLAALNTPGTTTVIEPTATRDHTERMLGAFGWQLETKNTSEGNEISLSGQQEVAYSDIDFSVPADPSSAAFAVVAALITPESEIAIPNVCINPLRTGLFIVLGQMGAKIEFKNKRTVHGEPIADIHIASSQLRGIEVPAALAPSMIDEYPILSIAAACASGSSIMHGLRELRVKESDRLAAIVAGLNMCGVESHAENDTLHITGCAGPPGGGGTVATHYDHRIAMSFLVMGMASRQPVKVDDGSAIITSFPGFTELMNGIGAKMENEL